MRTVDPQSLPLDAYQILRARTATNNSLVQTDFWLLMLIGLAGEGLLEMAFCKSCIRWAIPGQQFCRQHTQMKRLPYDGGEGLETVSEKAKRYQLGKKVSAKHNYFFSETPAYAKISAATLPVYVQPLLWGEHFAIKESLKDDLLRQIDESERLQGLLGGSLAQVPPSQILRILRERIDPYEYRPQVWKWKLRRTRLWFRFEEKVLNQPRKRKLRSWILILSARDWEKKGHSKAEIARILKIRPSTISNWLSRYGAQSISELVEGEMRKRGKPY